jgi:hypothetical protein
MRGLAMASSPRQVGDGPGTAGKAFALVLELSLAEGDPVSGTVSVAGGQPATPFHGWIDLMSAINSLRAEVNPSHSRHADDRQLITVRHKDPAVAPASMACGNDHEAAP